MCLLISLVFSLSPARAMAGDVFSEVTFFGDSTTAHLAKRGGIPQSRVWSGKNSTVLFETVTKTRCVHLNGADYTLRDAVALQKPKILVVTLGVSGGAGTMPISRFTEIYREMLLSIKAASPDTKILVQSILPLADASVKHYRYLTKQSVISANQSIKALCAEMNIPYLDTHGRLIDPATGYLKKEYQNDEYMHLTKAAYAVVLSSVREKLSLLGWI